MKVVMRMIQTLWRKFHLTQIAILLAAIVVLAGLGAGFYFMKSADVETLKQGLSQSTIIYDRDGDKASKLSATRTNSVSIEKMPEHLQEAIVAVEDNRFYEHGGFDVKGIFRAAFTNLMAGSRVQGASTLTQQLTKNALLSPEKTYRRKIEELFLAIEIEKVYKKEEILEMYLNTSYFGNGAWGVQNAAKRYFGKDVSELTLAESSMLAGMVKAPSRYNPIDSMDNAVDRRQVVLNQMVKYGYLTENEADEAANTEVTLKDASGDPLKGKYAHYADAVINEAISRYGLTQDDLLSQGYNIYTAMDQNVQAGLEDVYENSTVFPQTVNGEDTQSAAVLMDPKSGGVLGVVGRRGEHVFRGFSFATQMKKSPGSTIKPLAVYTPALEEGYKPTDMLVDEKMSFGKGEGAYSPSNYSDTYEGEMPMYRAIEKSANVPAVWLLDQIGLSKGVNSLERFGLEAKDPKLGLALGDITPGVSPLQMAEAYSAFSNDGVRKETFFIQKIIGPEGEIKPKWEPKEVKVTSKEVTDEMTAMLLGVVERGSGKRAQVDGVDIAGKTGSTQVPIEGIDGTEDQWFVGYTPNLVGAVWVGVEEVSKTNYMTTNSSDGAVPLFGEVVSKILPYIGETSFDVDAIDDNAKPEEEHWYDGIVEKWNEWF
ncbi:PBP1A family penicillin-binding protein [Domibacillus sp. DTU_2020_1001157_1_SI_ALB_TIR_016]|uniref:transglycosylase domain-containing protein n=1 Tax=Domibacillus sp. DTU_2020_1001157_1_SI_ALB_TIR_016 TaxID=3077789 RepID=UPI0028E2E5FE|nr:PBP1A family penicillin-binding protein [Domibacillus sp. DTU_2020_1001157_1_SI_ALB_TIR_016]WNS80112.1 PBP1A family penicillin-binding protein [Domibacillus sp. DTU_2020_1001157_1_SI_ALB_TIR_016]